MRTNKIGWWITAVVAVVVLTTGGIAIAVSRNSGGGNTTTTAPSAPPPSEAQPSAAPPSPGYDITGPLDLLLLGVDTRVSIPDWLPHTDAIMLLHVEPDLKSAYLYSLPRDLRVPIPAFRKAGFGGGTYKITEAMAFGSRVPGSSKADVKQGYELLTRTLSQYTGIKEFQAGAILNFGGLAKLVDQLGGVTMNVDQKVRSHHRKPDGSMRPLAPGGGDYLGPQMVYPRGQHHFVGWQAIDYARQRYGLPHGDYDRQRHQRQLVEAILGKALKQGFVSDLGKLHSLMTALGKALVDVGNRPALEYAYALRNLTPADITRVSLPGGSVMIGGMYRGEQVRAEGRAFLKAVAADRVESFLAKHPKLVDK